MLDRLEEAALPTTPAKRKKELCTFVVVGGGPMSVNIAADLHDMLHADMKKLFPQLHEFIELKFIDVGSASKNTYDQKVASWFQADFTRCEHVKVEKSKVLNVTEKEITLEHGVKIPYGVLVWSTQPGTTPLIESIRKFNPDVQKNKHALVTNAYLQVKGVGDGDIYAVGECATLAQPHIINKLKNLFGKYRRFRG
jgi:NADH dehydrogenase FAD-containing subunit